MLASVLLSLAMALPALLERSNDQALCVSLTEEKQFSGDCDQFDLLIKQYRHAYIANPLLYPSDLAGAVCNEAKRAGSFTGACEEFVAALPKVDMQLTEAYIETGSKLPVPTWLVYLGTIIAIWTSCAVVARRLHDIGLSGSWLLLGFLPNLFQYLAMGTDYLPAANYFSMFSTAAFLLVNGFVRGTRGHNRYGANPAGKRVDVA